MLSNINQGLVLTVNSLRALLRMRNTAVYRSFAEPCFIAHLGILSRLIILKSLGALFPHLKKYKNMY